MSAVLDGDPLYLAQGSRILVIGRNSLDELEQTYATAPLGGQVAGLIRMDDFLIAALRSEESGYLTWFSLEDELQPVRLHDFSYSDGAPSIPLDIIQSGDFLYVADGFLGLVPIDLSDPFVPRILEPVEEVLMIDGGLAMAGTDTLLAWSTTPIGGGGVKILDISSPQRPEPRGTYVLAGMAPKFDVVAVGDLMVVIAGVIDIVDISTPHAPVLLASRASGATSGVLVEDHLLVGSEGAIRSWDLSTPSMPVTQSPVAAPADRTRQIARGTDSNDLIFFTHDGLALAVNAESPAMPQLEDVLELAVGEEVLRVATGPHGPIVIDQGQAVRTLDENLDAIARLTPSSPQSRFEDVEIDEGTGLGLLITDGGVYTANLTNAGNPELLGFVANAPEAFGAAAVDGDRAWLVTSTTGSLVELDLSDPEVPLVNHIVESSSRAIEIAYSSGYVYVTYRDDGLGIFRVDAEHAPELVGEYGPCLAGRAVDVQGTVVGLVCNDEWHFIDVFQPEAPELLSKLTLPGISGVVSILLEADRAWAGHFGGVVLIDLEDPSAPFVLSEYRLAGWAVDLAFAPKGIWVAAREGGIARLQYPDSVSSGQSAAWFDPERAGEGWIVEVLDDNQAVGYWSTFDSDGDPRWLIGMGAIRHNRIIFEMDEVRGGRFGPAFDPETIELTPAGVVRMIWTGCDQGWFQYLPDGAVALEIDIRRLTRTAELDECGGPQESITESPARQSGTWYDPTQAGQGFSLQRLDTGSALVTWYTFDPEGNPYWMIGVGHDEGESIVFPELSAARGARFGDAFDPEDVELINWGELRMQLDCLSGSAEYASNLPDFGSGQLQLERLTVLKGLSCN